MTIATLKWRVPTSVQASTAMRVLTIVCWCAIVLGIALRFVQLPTRVMYIDEAITELRVAGHTDAQVIATLYDGRPRTALALRKMSTVGSGASPALLVASLEKEDAQHPPLFYLIELAIVRLFGNALWAWRLLPAVFGVLTLPAAYALGRALFSDRNAALMTAALFAVSPIERIYSDQAREYSLLTLFVVLATLGIVRAARTSSLRWWLAYSVMIAAGFYTSPFMGYAVAGHAVFVAATSWRKNRLRMAGFGAAVAAALALYSPWIFQLAIHRNDISATNVWSATKWPLTRLAAKWVFNTGSAFFDLEYLNLRWMLVLALVAVLVGFAIVRALRSVDPLTRWCLSSAIVVPALLLVLPDILLGEHRSSVARYSLPVLAMLIVLAARGLSGRPLAATIVLAAGLLCGFTGAQHPSWWDNDANADDGQIASIINSEPHAQVLSTIAPPGFITYSQLLRPGVVVRLSPTLRTMHVSHADPIFVLAPGPNDIAALHARTGLRFTRIAYHRALTAREIGARIGTSKSPREPAAEAAELYATASGFTQPPFGPAGVTQP